MKTQRTAMQDFHGASVANASWFHLGQRVVVVDAAEFDAYRNATKDLIVSAELSLDDNYAMHLELAIEAMKKLEGGEG